MANYQRQAVWFEFEVFTEFVIQYLCLSLKIRKMERMSVAPSQYRKDYDEDDDLSLKFKINCALRK